MTTFTITEIIQLKTLAVKAKNFELAAKCRDAEKSHPDYKPKKWKRVRLSDKLRITNQYISKLADQYGDETYLSVMKLLNSINKSKPSGKNISKKNK